VRLLAQSPQIDLADVEPLQQLVKVRRAGRPAVELLEYCSPAGCEIR
jgi:hypothetical protein